MADGESEVGPNQIDKAHNVAGSKKDRLAKSHPGRFGGHGFGAKSTVRSRLPVAAEAFEVVPRGTGRRASRHSLVLQPSRGPSERSAEVCRGRTVVSEGLGHLPRITGRR